MAGDKAKSIFSNFTNLYSLSKTLRFELRPIWNTQKMLDDEKYPIVERDRVRHEKYEAVKPWFDRLHREFITDALKNFKFKDLETYKCALELWQQDKKSKQKKEALAKIESELRGEIVNHFVEVANKWMLNDKYKSLSLKNEGLDIFFGAGVFKLLKERFKGEKDTMVDGINIFDDWGKWTGYFKKFFETRKNFYKSDDTSTAISYRIVNQNLRRFCENLQFFKAIKGKVDISEVENNFNKPCTYIFSLEFYNECLLQEGINLYNKIIGGELRCKDEKIRGINELINKYRQDNNGEKLSFLKILDKQIHSEKELFIESIKTDSELMNRLRAFYKNANEKVQMFRKLVCDTTRNHPSYDLNKIYFSKDALTRNANRWFSDYDSFEQDLFTIVSEKQNKAEYELLRTHKDDSKIGNKDGKLSFPDFIKCSHIELALEKQAGRSWKEKYYEILPDLEKTDIGFAQFMCVFQFELEQQFSREITDINTGEQKEIGYEIFAKRIKELLIHENPSISSDEKIDVRNFADFTLSIYQIAKYFAVEKRRRWLDNYELDDRFYKFSSTGYLNFYQEAYEQIVQPYNLFRNYLTKKPFNANKWVLNFENPTLADGWDKNKEKENTAVILRSNSQYYLGIMREGHRDIFTSKYKEEAGVGAENSTYEKMVYRQVADASKDIHNLVLMPDGMAVRFTKMEKKQEHWPKEITAIKEKKSYAKENFNRQDFELFVNYFKKCAISYWADFTFKFSPTEQYKNIKDFTDEIERFGYKLFFSPISEKYIREKNKDGELFLFEIHNKDWNLRDGKLKTAAKNLHTLYFEHLFSPENERENFLFKLNGEAELFFRPKTKEKKLGYKIKEPKSKKWIQTNRKQNGAVVDRKRYAEDIILLHCPITLNRISKNKTEFELNTDVRKAISNSDDIHIIGVDRGEKHLVYYSIIDQKGTIIETGSLNTIGQDGQKKAVNYAKKLEERAKNRDESRREWKDVESIKDLKQGYISQVVHKFADMVIQNPGAIIVFEDLNMRFKQVRGGIEKSVYQQLEKALIDKFSFLAKKTETDVLQTGNVLRAYQLAYPVNAFRDMGKQTGIIFYTQAGYTSKTCPICGYRRNVKFQFENIKQANELVANLESIEYKRDKNIFTISYSLKKFLNKEQSKERELKNELYVGVSSKDFFVLTTQNAIRYKWYDRYSAKAKIKMRGVEEYKGESQESETRKGVIKSFDITEYIKGLFGSNSINYLSGDIKKQIELNNLGKEFYQNLLYAFFLLSETRHSISGSGVDYIHCPECGFDSRKGFQKKEFNGDANGAYNIARKGIMILNKIRQFEENEDITKMEWGDLSVSITEWDKFTQQQRELAVDHKHISPTNAKTTSFPTRTFN